MKDWAAFEWFALRRASQEKSNLRRDGWRETLQWDIEVESATWLDENQPQHVRIKEDDDNTFVVRFIYEFTSKSACFIFCVWIVFPLGPKKVLIGFDELIGKQLETDPMDVLPIKMTVEKMEQNKQSLKGIQRLSCCRENLVS